MTYLLLILLKVINENYDIIATYITESYQRKL